MTQNALTRLLALFTTLLLLGTSQSYACTGLLVGKGASTDGSLIVLTHTRSTVSYTTGQQPTTLQALCDRSLSGTQASLSDRFLR